MYGKHTATLCDAAIASAVVRKSQAIYSIMYVIPMVSYVSEVGQRKENHSNDTFQMIDTASHILRILILFIDHSGALLTSGCCCCRSGIHIFSAIKMS